MRFAERAKSGGALAAPGRVVAVLGPTNTGKTHLAMERMLAHRSGMIGFPLRLLARENFDRAVAAAGKDAVALITGEELIIPPNPRFFVCTVEAMPIDRPVAFLAVDEIQLCADAERGHIFTDRLLHARGLEETMVLGADTMRPLIQQMIPRTEVIERPRFSSLTYAGHKKLTRLPPRSAVVAFSAADVYSIAEMIRRQRGGTAVVLGALSPRTRNAQVALYQAGEVDWLVATDAIGMGLNLDVDHVAFAKLVKFDGELPRRLAANEIAQIAGRAGRHKSDGTFGTTGDLDGLTEDLVERVETHTFETLKALRWRNHDLPMGSVAALLRSLDQRPPRPELIRVRSGDDHQALAALARDPDILALAQGRERVEMLWEVCRIPDFRKTLTDAHARLLGQIYRYLAAPAGRLPTDWVARQVARLDRTEGDIDTLIARIAHVRTWTYVSNRGTWLDDPGHWQAATRAIEDRLSDALHDRLTQRFVDRRSASLAKTLRESGQLFGSVAADGAVLVEGHPVGQLEGFRFIPDISPHGDDTRALLNAARRALKDEIGRRVRRLEQDGDERFAVAADGLLTWDTHAVGRLVAGRPSVLAPGVLVLADGFLDPGQSERVRLRLETWLADWVTRSLKPLLALRSEPWSGAARGLAFQLIEGLGDLPRQVAGPVVTALAPADRQALRRLGVRIGRSHIFMPALLKPALVAIRALVWSVAQGQPLPAPVPPPGRVSVSPAPAVPPAFYAAIGYPVAGPRAIRVDILDRLESQLLTGGPALSPERRAALASLVGVAPAEVDAVIAALGFRLVNAEDGSATIRARKPLRRRPDRAVVADEHPFAKLKDLCNAR